MATAAPVTVTQSWGLLAATGYQWLFELHDGSIRLAFNTTTPGATVLGHSVATGDVVSPPTGLSIYARSEAGSVRVTLTQGDAL